MIKENSTLETLLLVPAVPCVFAGLMLLFPIAITVISFTKVGSVLWKVAEGPTS